MSWLGDRRVALAALTLFTLLAGDVWRYSITWYGWGVVVAAILAAWILIVVRHGVDLRRLPISLGVLLTLMAASIAWSFYPGASAIGVIATVATACAGVAMGLTVSLDQLLRALGVALRWIIGLSLAFELFAAAILRRPVLPFWGSYDEPIAPAFYWSRGLLLEGGRIQGIAGNANLLAFAALLGVIVFAIQIAEKRVGQAAGWGWLAAAALTLGLTRSSTVLVCGLAVIVAIGVVVLARRLSGRGQAVLAALTLIGVTALIVLSVVFRSAVLGLLGRSSDATNRLDIWATVIELSAQRPVFGWGWVSYWPPWVAPFDDLIVIRGVTYLQAHNAWLDVALQLGIVGVVVFSILVLSTSLRVLSWSVDAPRGDAASSPILRLLPLALLTAVLVQSLAESRLLVEAGFLLLVYLAVASRVRGVTAPHVVTRSGIEIR